MVQEVTLRVFVANVPSEAVATCPALMPVAHLGTVGALVMYSGAGPEGSEPCFSATGACMAPGVLAASAQPVSHPAARTRGLLRPPPAAGVAAQGCAMLQVQEVHRGGAHAAALAHMQRHLAQSASAPAH